MAGQFTSRTDRFSKENGHEHAGDDVLARAALALDKDGDVGAATLSMRSRSVCMMSDLPKTMDSGGIHQSTAPAN